MKQFTVTIAMPSNSKRDSVHVAQMLREVAGTLEYQVPMKDHLHVYDRYGVQKYEWDVGDPAAPIDQDARRQRRTG